jgi:hypothetical protein
MSPKDHSSANEGVRRLSLIVGVVGLVLFLVPAAVAVVSVWRSDVASEEEISAANLENFRHTLDELEPHLKAMTHIPNIADRMREFKKTAQWREIEKRRDQRDTDWMSERRRTHHEGALLSLLAAAVGALLAFVVPWGAVRGIAWVVAGFQQQR